MTDSLTDLATEVVAQLAQINEADAHPLQLRSGQHPREVVLGIQHSGARVMYVLRQQLPPANDQPPPKDIHFGLADADDAIDLFVAMTTLQVAGENHYLHCDLMHGDLKLATLMVRLEAAPFNVSESSVGRSLKRMLSIIKSAVVVPSHT